MVFYEVFFVFLGVLGLWFGSDIAVSAAKRIASMLNISGLIVGLTIASVGTSLPEIFTNVMAGFSTLQGADASGIAVGNIIGSDLAQITLLLGIVGMIATLHISKRSLRRDGGMMLVALILMFVVCVDGYVNQIEGAFLVIIYLLYLGLLLRQEEVIEKMQSHRGEGSLLLQTLKCLAGIVVVVYAANLAVENGVSLAEYMGISSSLIGLFIGLGTSIPELSVSIRALTKGSGTLSLGNLIGSNITDPLLSFGLGATIAGVKVAPEILRFDFVYWIVATLIALLMLFNHMDLNKKESSVLILLYLLFMYLRVVFFP